MSREKIFTVKRTIYLSPPMWEYVTQLAAKQGRDYTESDVIREALRAFIDGQAEIIGSRRHFQKSMQEYVGQVEERIMQQLQSQHTGIHFYLHVLMQLVALCMAHVIGAVTRKEVSAQQLIQRAVIEARRELFVLDAQVQSVRDMTSD